MFNKPLKLNEMYDKMKGIPGFNMEFDPFVQRVKDEYKASAQSSFKDYLQRKKYFVASIYMDFVDWTDEELHKIVRRLYLAEKASAVKEKFTMPDEIF
jgi:hypothetical protein